MSRLVYFITHPEVVIDPAIAVPRWPLSPRGRERMLRLLRQPWVRELQALYCSDEQKAIDGAEILSRELHLPCTTMAALGENDRSSTGYLPKDQFEALANEFFTHPDASVRGWERAVDAQTRIVRAVDELAQSSAAAGPIGIVSHGGVGALLLSHVCGRRISRADDQPGGGGGNYFVFTWPEQRLVHGWQRIDDSL